MTTAAGALASTEHLTKFDGKDVLRTTIAVTNAGDGLSKALAIEPTEMHHGQRVFVVLDCEVDKVTFVPIDGTSALTRVHVLKAGTGTIMDATVVKKAIDDQAEKIRKAAEVGKGVHDLFDDTALTEAHERGDHADGPVKNCPPCESEKAEAKAEAEAKVAPISGRRKTKEST